MRENKDIKMVTKEISYTGNLEEWREEIIREVRKGDSLIDTIFFFFLLSRRLVSLQKQNGSFLYTLDVL